jgi:hypothetical protein
VAASAGFALFHETGGGRDFLKIGRIAVRTLEPGDSGVSLKKKPPARADGRNRETTI